MSTQTNHSWKNSDELANGRQTQVKSSLRNALSLRWPNQVEEFVINQRREQKRKVEHVLCYCPAFSRTIRQKFGHYRFNVLTDAKTRLIMELICKGVKGRNLASIWEPCIQQVTPTPFFLFTAKQGCK